MRIIFTALVNTCRYERGACMAVWDSIKAAFSFENRPQEFELLETERGEPGFWGGWRDAAPREFSTDERVAADIEQNAERLRREFRIDINPDIVLRKFSLGGRETAMAVFITGMVNGDAINDFILRAGMRKDVLDGVNAPYADYLCKHVFTFCEAAKQETWSKIRSAVLDGLTAVFINGEEGALVMDTRGYEHRTVDAPQNEKTVRGPQEAFCENLRTNITLIRRLVRTEDLICEIRPTGADNGTKLVVIYRDGVANAALVNEVKRRLASVKTRVLQNIGVLEQLTEAHPLSPLPQLLSTERPDRVAAYVMQGHVAVLLDGSQFANITPTTLHTLMTSPEDAYLRRPQGTVIRTVRYVGAAISVLLPAYFLSLALHHQGLLSVEVLSTLISSRKMVFAPLGTEMLFLLVVFQLIREAGLRVPGSIGQAIGIIGGLILGQAAVAANLASSVVLIVVALSGLGNFCVPDYSTQIAVSILRVIITISAWAGGLLGMTGALVIILAWLCSLKSYGVPFLAPFSPKTYSKYPLVRRGSITPHTEATDFTNTMQEADDDKA